MYVADCVSPVQSDHTRQGHQAGEHYILIPVVLQDLIDLLSHRLAQRQAHVTTTHVYYCVQ